MMPLEHMRVRRRKDVIRLLYASKEYESLAETLISFYEDHRGKNRMVLNEALSDCEMLGYDFKLVRGLSTVLEDRSIFENQAVLNPSKVRNAVFSEAGRQVITTEEDRKRIIASTAFKLGISTLDLEQSLYADLADEQMLTEFESVTPINLLKEYNFALTIGLLAHAKRLEISYKSMDEKIEDFAKKLGSSNITRSRSSFKLITEWQTSSRIGYKSIHLEAILGKLLSQDDWSLSSDVVFPLKSGKQYSFHLSSNVHGIMMKPGFTRGQLVSHKKPSSVSVVKKMKGEIAIVSDVARRLRITENQVREIYADSGLVEVEGVLFSEKKMDEIVEALECTVDFRFGTVRSLLKELGVKSPVPVLEALGYDIEWNRKRDESLIYRLGPRKR